MDGGAPTNTEDSKAEAPEGRADVDELTQTFQKALDGLKSKASELDGVSRVRKVNSSSSLTFI